MKKIIVAIVFLGFLVSCTKNFENINKDPNQISTDQLLEDNNLIGASFKSIMFNLFGHQIEEDLCYDSWMGYMNTPTDFVGNVNNTTYYIRWNSYWGRIYGSVMSPSKKAIEYAELYDAPLFADWAKLMQVMAMSKLTAIHGPVIYSNYGSSESSILYDKESDLYNTLFSDLDKIQASFADNVDDKRFFAFDLSYDGKMPQWMKLINSLRLRLAMRLSKVAPDIAKAEGEKALSDPAGLIESNADNFWISLIGNIMPVAQICYQWDDTRMGGVIESFMAGYNDGRAAKMFEPAGSIAPNTLPADPNHPTFPYKGIRNGAYCGPTKPFMLQYSKVSNDFNSVQRRRAFTASEVAFLKAEAALRGWAGAGDAKENYENGIRLSFADWGATGVEEYIANSTSKPLDYVDPADPRNNFTQPSTVTIAWNEADNNELKLEKIITQKYLNTFTNTLEAWVDFRRTGYPKIPHVAKNDSGPDWGVIPANEWIKRMPFVDAERTSNAAAVADAVGKMGSGAKDDIATRLWWDTGGPNF